MSALRRRVGATALACLGLGSAVALVAPGPLAPTAAAAPAAANDFNGDGYADLAVGVPLEDVGTTADAGAVQVFYGAAGGLSGTRSLVLHQNVNGVADTAERGDRFGSAVAMGDLNGDGFGDLAVGVPLEDVGTRVDAGAVQVFYGSSTGLQPTRNQFLTQDSAGALDVAEAGDRFGGAVAVGDVAGSTIADLAVGVPLEDVGRIRDAGAVHLLRGSRSGVTTTNDQLVHQNSAGANDVAETGDHFGQALAVGDVSGSTKRDLVVGIPYENVGRVADAGAVHVLRGTGGALSTAGDQVISQNTKNVADKAETGDRFGWSLAVADLAGNSKADLAVGVPRENVGSISDAGAVHLLRGGTGGVSASGDQLVSQNTRGVADVSEKSDLFGYSVTAANLAGSGKADLAVGVPLENVVGQTDAGAVAVFEGSTPGLRTADDKLIHQSNRGSDAAAEKGDQFGAALASANLVGSGYADLAVGVPNENVGAAPDGGSVQVFRGATNGVTISGDQVVTQSITGAPSAAERSDRFGSAVTAR
ncbi:FG-GAP repeat-containing protein [Friedmanniella luteola]|uniref:FG-GAP repeat-containing protein n=1 Tax=Friedmanniella luteola TaxID=546871 RepID=A0A1H1MKE9_9ACTN|nr:VCBS repeat-containing protein [Friedmanniella luteola]SDR87137.1 FG-GAP repeat-containing protein [Friedmanniella luteola]